MTKNFAQLLSHSNVIVEKGGKLGKHYHVVSKEGRLIIEECNPDHLKKRRMGKHQSNSVKQVKQFPFEINSDENKDDDDDDTTINNNNNDHVFTHPGTGCCSYWSCFKRKLPAIN